MRLSCMALFFISIGTVSGFVPAAKPSQAGTNLDMSKLRIGEFLASAVVASSCLVSPLIVSADEYGRETEAPTFSTGETVEICTKRGPLGACLSTERRTVQNDNDKAEKYFKGGKTVQQSLLEAQREEESGNALIEKLRQQSIDNKEKNDLIVAQKTFENDASATFGPFDKQVLIMNTDQKTFTLLSNPQAMRLKDAGFIQGRKFVKQPSEEEIEKALASTQELPAFLKAILSSDDASNGEL